MRWPIGPPLHGLGDLLVAEAQLFGGPQHLQGHGPLVLLTVGLQQVLVVCDVLHLVQEPAVDLGQLVQAVHRIARAESGRQDEDALVRGRLQLLEGTQTSSALRPDETAFWELAKHFESQCTL